MVSFAFHIHGDTFAVTFLEYIRWRTKFYAHGVELETACRHVKQNTGDIEDVVQVDAAPRHHRISFIMQRKTHHVMEAMNVE